MSKHEKHVRRERKKTDRARRSRSLIRNPGTSPTRGSAIQNGAAALAAAAAIAAGTAAYASPVRFDNPAHGDAGHFHWTNAPGGVGDPSTWLDITRVSTDQAGGQVFSSVGQIYGYGYYPNYTGGAAAVVYANTGYTITDVFAAGTLIDGFLGTFATTSDHIKGYYGEYSNFVDGVSTYMAARFSDFDGYHYGWIGVVRSGFELQPFAWGYETEVGVAIPAGIPEPGSLALLAFGACALLRRRRLEA